MANFQGWAFVAVCLLAVGCAKPASNSRAEGRIRVVATTGMVGDVVRNVGGDKVEVVVLMGPGTDPHLYKASPGDIDLIQGADAVVYHGLHLEGKMAEVFERLRNRKPTLAVAEALPKDRLLQSTTSGGAVDPHVWFDAGLWLRTATPVAEFLAKIEPTRGDEFRSNAKAYEGRLEALHKECGAEIAKIPKDRRTMITAHDAFGYFGRAYGIEVLGIQGISTESEASLKEVNRLVETIVARKIPAIFVETSVSPKNVQALLEGARSRGMSTKIGGSLFSDAMGADGTPEGTYEGMVRANVKTIVAGLSQ